jgi:hypothetical protein
MQKYGINYNEIFSPVIRMEVFRLLLTFGALKDLEIRQMDVKTAPSTALSKKTST